MLKQYCIDIEQAYLGEICQKRFGDWKNIHRRWSRWSASGVGEKIFKYLAADADNEYGMIDSTIVRAHPHSAGALKKRKR